MNITQMKQQLVLSESRLLKARENVERYSKHAFGLEYNIEFLKQQIAKEESILRQQLPPPANNETNKEIVIKKLKEKNPEKK